MADISVTVDEAVVELFTSRPQTVTGPGWKVQYFNGGDAITTPSTKVRRTVFLDAGQYLLTATWTKDGQDPVTTATPTLSNIFYVPGA